MKEMKFFLCKRRWTEVVDGRWWEEGRGWLEVKFNLFYGCL